MLKNKVCVLRKIKLELNNQIEELVISDFGKASNFIYRNVWDICYFTDTTIGAHFFHEGKQK